MTALLRLHFQVILFLHPIDLEIRELKKRVQHKMMEKAVPERLWDHALLHAAKIRQFLPRDQLKGRTAIETVTGKTPDISEYCDFDFYDLVWYHPGHTQALVIRTRHLAGG